MSLARPISRLLFLTALVLPAVPRPAMAGGDLIWTFAPKGEIKFQRVTPLGNLVVSTDEALQGVDPATGQATWTRDDIHKLAEAAFDIIPDTPLAVLNTGRTEIEVIDVQTGQKKWDSKAIGVNSTSGQLLVPQKRMLILYASTGKGAKMQWVGVDAETGEKQWAQPQEEWFKKAPLLYGVKGSGLIKRQTIEGNQPPVFDTDDTMILFISPDGPVKIDLNTGKKLWTAKLDTKSPAATRNGYDRMFVSDEVLYVPYEHELEAVRVSDGTLVWAVPPKFRGMAVQMEMTAQGLVVRGAPGVDEKGKPDGKPFLEVVDPKTGARTWKKPYKDLEAATSFAVKDGKIYIEADEELNAVDIGSGAPTLITKVKFEGHEVPTRLEMTDTGFLLQSSQNLQMVDFTGKQLWAAYYKAPGASMFAKIATTAAIAGMNAASAGSAYQRAYATGNSQTYYLSGNPTLSKRYKATTLGSDSQFILSNLEPAAGPKGPGIVRVSKKDGQLVSQVVLGEKDAEYELDEVENLLFYKKSDREIVAFKM